MQAFISTGDAPNPGASPVFDGFRLGDIVLPIQSKKWSTEPINIDDDGDDICQIVSNDASDDEDVDQSPPCSISIITNDEANDELLDVYEADDKDLSTRIRFHSHPDALLTITYLYNKEDCPCVFFTSQIFIWESR